VRLVFTHEQESLRRMVRDLLAARAGESEVRRLMDTDTGIDPALWAEFAGLGLCGLAVPEEFGGAGAGFVEVGVVLEELGASLACLPYLSSVVLAQSLLLACDDRDAQARWLPGLATGDIRATVALNEAGGWWDGREPGTRARADGAGWRLSGEKTFVLDGHTADLVFVVAGTERGSSVFAVTDGCVRTSLPTMDQTRKQARLEFDGTPAELVGTDGGGAAPVSRMLEIAATGLSAEAVGGARAVLDSSVAYARTRVQFGRPIGGFQAIKHKCADLLLRVETARSAAYHALWTVAENDPDELPLAAGLAKAYCTDAYAHAAEENIQIHGGIGFTWEHSAHLHYKRAKSSQLLFGDPAQHRELLADRIGI
jgi:alkylation response protein AidB-like acyl-CoA dehydrogenase